MKSVWQERDRREVLDRIEHLTADTTPRWGRMTAPQMLAHINDTFRMTFGELRPKPQHLALRHPPLRQLIVYLLPFPKNTRTAPELIGRKPGDWAHELAECRRLIARFGTEPLDREWPEHFVLGRLSAAEWGVLGYKHMDHHLRQFGV